MWFSARAVSTSGSVSACAAATASATRCAARRLGSIPLRSRVVVLDREPRCAGRRKESDGLGDAAGIVRVAALAVDVERERRARRRAPRRARRARRASRSDPACRAPTRIPGSSWRAPRTPRRRGAARIRRPTGWASRRARRAHGARGSERAGQPPTFVLLAPSRPCSTSSSVASGEGPRGADRVSALADRCANASAIASNSAGREPRGCLRRCDLAHARRRTDPTSRLRSRAVARRSPTARASRVLRSRRTCSRTPFASAVRSAWARSADVPL